MTDTLNLFLVMNFSLDFPCEKEGEKKGEKQEVQNKPSLPSKVKDIKTNLVKGLHCKNI